MATSARKLRIEMLEQKQLLAGDVFVNVVNGALHIQGDDLDNQIAVSSGEDPGTYVIRGLNGTNVMMRDGTDPTDGDPAEGQAPEQAVVVEGVRRGIRARMGAGDDTVILNDIHVNRSVSIATGQGNDNVLVGVRPDGEPGPVPAEFADPDSVPGDRPSVAIRGNLNIHTGAGEDHVAIDDTTARGRLRLATGLDDDRVSIGRSNAATDGDETTRPEHDVRFGRGARIHLGAGDDAVGINDLHARRNVIVNGGLGSDDIGINSTHARSMFIYGGRGEGADQVGIHNTTTHVLFAALGGGDDTLSMGGVKAQLALLSGGPGDGDTLNDLGENIIRHQRAFGFELPAAEEEEESDLL